MNMKWLEAAHHKWQRRILGVTWRDKIRNEEIRRRTGMETMEVILRKIRLQWLGRVHRMDNRQIPHQALTWFPKDGRRGPGRPRKSWSDTVIEDLQNIEITWTDSGETADDGALWKSCITQCVPRRRERTKVR